jgi:FtsP/CotA-like multicopper oxidase with cupredoxin domain
MKARIMTLVLLGASTSLASLSAAPLSIVLPNDNLRPAGRQEGNVLTVRMYAATGTWHPKGSSGPAIDAAAFGEEGAGLSIPAPLIRARVGTTVVLSLRNDLGSELRVHGLCTKPGPCEPVVIAAGQSRDIRFSLNAAGTYSYWAARSGTLDNRPPRDSQLGGAIVVDPPTGARPDRIFVIGLYWDAETPGRCVTPPGPNHAFTINGASWPVTDRLHYKTGETVHWRVINLSCDAHAMHLHGFHFVVDAAGDGETDEMLGSKSRTVVTEQLDSGQTISMTWTPTRSGNWLFHCHMVLHMMRLPTSQHAMHENADDDAGMTGLVVGIDVTGPDVAATPSSAPTRRFTMVLNEDADRYGKGLPGFRVELEDTDAPRLTAGPVPGPVLVLHRGEPTEITVLNRTSQPSAIHWHGIEIESYFDGVPGFGGEAGHVAPPVAAGKSFVVRMTPPRAGTFMYHTHWHDETQLTRGLYGPLIVLEPAQTFDPAVDHILMIGQIDAAASLTQRSALVLNGRTTPEPIVLRAGVPNRLRVINITPNAVGLQASLVNQFDLVQWTVIARDGADLGAGQRSPGPSRQLVAVGETCDLELTPLAPQNMWFNLQSRIGMWILQAPVQVK